MISSKTGGYRQGMGGVLLVLALLAGWAGCRDHASESRRAGEEVVADAVSIDPSSPRRTQLEQILSMTDVLDRVGALVAFLQTADPADLDEIRIVFENAALNRGDLELALMAEWWAEFDPVGAFEWADTFWLARQPRIKAAVVRAWARRDPHAAAEYGYGSERLLNAPFMARELIDAMIIGWVESGEPGALEWAAEFAQTMDRSRAMQAVVRAHVVRHGFDETIEWIRNHPKPNDNVRNLLYGAAVSITARSDPERAARFVEEMVESGVPDLGLYVRVAMGWARTDPVAAIDWVRSRPDGEEKMMATERVVREWVRMDSAAAVDWLRMQVGKTSESEDYLMVELSRQEAELAHWDPDWPAIFAGPVQAIQLDKRRTGVMTWLLTRWLIVDEEGAEAWLAENEWVPEESRVLSKAAVPADLIQSVRKAYEEGRAAAGA